MGDVAAFGGMWDGIPVGFGASFCCEWRACPPDLVGLSAEWLARRKPESGRYSNVSDYVRDLIRRDQERTAMLAELQKLVTEGIESGISNRSPEDRLKAAREKRRRILRVVMPYGATQKADQDVVDICLWGWQEFGRRQAGFAATLDLIADNPRIAGERTELCRAERLAIGMSGRRGVNTSVTVRWQHCKRKFLRRFQKMHADARR